MSKLVLFFFIQIIFAQKKLTVYSTLFDYRVDIIEREILINTVNLHNRALKKKDKLYITYIKKRPFGQVLEALLKHKRTDNVMAIATISATADRVKLFESSSVYFPNQEIIVCLKNQDFMKDETWNDGISPVAYQKNTIEETIIFDLKRKYKINSIAFNSYDEKLAALLNGRVLFTISDRVEVWDDNRLKIFGYLEDKYSKGFAFFYPKGSILKNKLEKHLKYFIKSTNFFLLIEEKYGREIRDYFIHELKKL